MISFLVKVKSFHHNNINQKGFGFLETLIGLLLVAMMFGVMTKTIRVLLSVWNESYASLKVSTQTHQTLRELKNRLKHAKSISLVSLSTNTNAYIRYIDANDVEVSVFFNSSANQSTLNLSNALSSSALVVAYKQNSVLTGPEILIDNLNSFTVKTYKADDSSDLVLLNNSSSPDYHDINSIKWIISKTIDNKTKTVEQLIKRIPDSLENDSSVSLGISGSLFNGNSSLTQFSVVNDLSGGGDQVKHSLDTYPVKIQNTGKYYSTINAAVSAANAGDVVLVSAGTYYENVLLKTDVTILGGYESTNWTRDIHTNQTKIINPGTGNAGTFYGYYDNNVVIDGFFIESDAQSNGIGVYAYVCSNIKVTNCWIDKSPNRGVYIYKGSATLRNLRVTANTSTVDFYQVTSTSYLERCWLYSKETAWSYNVYVRNSKYIYVRNNVILDGDVGVYVTGTGNSYIYIDNNVIKDSESYALYLYGTSSSYLYYIYARSNIIDNTNYAVYGMYTMYTYYYNNGISNYNYLSYFYSSYYYTFSGTFYPYGTTYWGSDYQLTGSSNYDNPYIDGGYMYSSNDADNTQKGTTTNDCGAYGGSYAGRVGVGNKHSFTSSSSTMADDIADNTYAGDHIILASGSYSPDPIELKKHRYMYGAGVQQTVLSNTNASALISMDEYSHLEGFSITGSGTTGVQINSYKSGVKITSCLFRDLSKGIDILAYASPTVRFVSMDNISQGIVAASGTYLDSSYNIFHNLGTGISVSGSYDSSSYSIFYNCSASTSGSISTSNDTSQTSSDKLFWSTTNNQHQLYDRAANPAINKYLDREAGCFEYYEKEATLLSSQFISSVARDYDSLDITLVPDSQYPVAKVSLIVQSGANLVTISPDLEITSASTTSYSWSIPQRIIAEDLQIKLVATSYTYNHPLVIDDFQLNY